MTAVAPATKTRLSISSPARVITPSRFLPAVEWFFGVKPSQAAKFLADLKPRASTTFIDSKVAPIGPTPGISRQPSAHLVTPMELHELFVERGDLIINTCQFGRQRLPRNGLSQTFEFVFQSGAAFPQSANQ